METVQNISKSVKEKEQQFDEQTKLQIQSILEEIDRKQQQSYQSTGSEGKRYIKFVSDKERKVLSFTGKVNKKDIQAKDYETGLDIPGRYTIRFLFECYDVTTSNSQETSGLPAIWERGTKDARTILYYLSKGIRVLEVVRNGQPYSTATTYLINPKMD